MASIRTVSHRVMARHESVDPELLTLADIISLNSAEYLLQNER
jgi:hypothetical protein